MELSEVIKKRRSIRRFLRTRVDDDKLVPVLESALWAPSAGNTPDKEFILVRDDNVKKEIAEACFNQVWIANAPVIIILLSQISKLRQFGDRAEFYASISAGAALQNMLLSLTDQGLQGTEVGLFDESVLKRLLNIPDDRKIFAVVPLGLPAEVPPAPKRFDIKAVTYFDKFGIKWIKDKPREIYGIKK